MDITHLPLASNDDGGVIRLVVIIVVIAVISLLKWLGKTIEEAKENVRRQQQAEQRRELERKLGNRPPVQTPARTGAPSQGSAPPPRPVPTRDFGGDVLLPSSTSRPAPVPVPVPVPKRPAPAPPRPGQAPPARQAAVPPGDSAQTVLLLKQVEQQIGILEGNLSNLQARRRQLCMVAGRPALFTPAAGTTVTTLNLNMQNPANVRQGIIVSEILRPPIGLREEDGAWAK